MLEPQNTQIAFTISFPPTFRRRLSQNYLDGLELAGLLLVGEISRLLKTDRVSFERVILAFQLIVWLDGLIVPMLVIAGAIEGFFSPNPAIPELLKYITGIVLFVLLISYFSLKRPTDKPNTELLNYPKT